MVERGSSNHQQEIKWTHCLADVVLGKRLLANLTDEDKYNYVKCHLNQVLPKIFHRR